MVVAGALVPAGVPLALDPAPKEGDATHCCWWRIGGDVASVYGGAITSSAAL